MAPGNRKEHWETVYQHMPLQEASWFQPKPETSLELIRQFDLPPATRIIDIGGGDSLLADHLLDMGFKDISVLDISKTALARARKRLGYRADQAQWIETDISSFTPRASYDLWHDRATFHFLTDPVEIEQYVQTAYQSLTPHGLLVMGTFSTQGPSSCSGLHVMQYAESGLTACFSPFFSKIACMTVDHRTPSGAIQNFLFCCFRRK